MPIQIDGFSDQAVLTTDRLYALNNKSLFYRWMHPFELKQARDELFQGITEHFSQKYQIHNHDQTKRACEFVLAQKNITWKKEDPLTVGQFKQMDEAFEQSLAYAGEGVNPHFGTEGLVAKVCHTLFAQRSGLPLSMLRWHNFKSVFLVEDPVFLAEFRSTIQLSLKEGLESYHAGKIDQLVLKTFVFNLVSLLPYAYPDEK